MDDVFSIQHNTQGAKSLHQISRNITPVVIFMEFWRLQKALDAFAPRRARLCTASCLLLELKSIGWRPCHAICARKLRDPAKNPSKRLVQIHSLTPDAVFGCFEKCMGITKCMVNQFRFPNRYQTYVHVLLGFFLVRSFIHSVILSFIHSFSHSVSQSGI